MFAHFVCVLVMLLLVISFMKVPQNLSNKAGQSEMKGFFYEFPGSRLTEGILV